jgi:Fic family protein
MDPSKFVSSRAGRLQVRPSGHFTFEPAPLPPAGLVLNGALHQVLSTADREVGFLHGQVAARPEAAAFADLACRQEAVASCRLDGSPVTLRDLLWYELDGIRADGLSCSRGDVRICANYASMLREDAEKSGADAAAVLGASLRASHKQLYRGVRGRDERAGHFRTAEIWIGPRGSTRSTAYYVPPAPEHITEHLARLLAFAVDDVALPPLARVALMACQLESIHPFVDGSGRITRLTLLKLLAETHGSATRLLCPSMLLAVDVGGHFGRMQRVRCDGDWEGWVQHFGCLIRDAAQAATATLVRSETTMREHLARICAEQPTVRETSILLLRHLASQPLVSVQQVSQICRRTFANANLLVRRLEALGILVEITGRQRHRRYVYQPYVGRLQATA